MPGYLVHGNGTNCATLPPSPYTGDFTFTDCPVVLCGPYTLRGTITNPAGCTVTIKGEWTIIYPKNTLNAETWFWSQVNREDFDTSEATFIFVADNDESIDP